MKKKIVGIFVCMLMILTAIPVVSTINFQTTWYVNENNYSELYPSTPTNSLGLITIKIVAKIDAISDPNNLLNAAIKVNDTISGKYIYDSGIPDSYPINTTVGLYEFTSSSCGIELKVGGLVFKTNPSDVNFAIQIVNNGIEFTDEYCLYSLNNLQLSNGMLVQHIQCYFEDLNGTAISSDALPTTPPVLSIWDSGNLLYIKGQDPLHPDNNYYIYAHVTKVTKNKARDVYFTTQPVLIWFLERFPNMLPIIRYLIKL